MFFGGAARCGVRKGVDDFSSRANGLLLDSAVTPHDIKVIINMVTTIIQHATNEKWHIFVCDHCSVTGTRAVPLAAPFAPCVNSLDQTEMAVAEHARDRAS